MSESLAAIKKKILKSKKLVLVKVQADWCQPCHALSKTLEKVLALDEFKDSVELVVYDATGREATLKEFGAKSIPVMITMRDGDEVDRVVGAIGADSIKEFLRGSLAT